MPILLPITTSHGALSATTSRPATSTSGRGQSSFDRCYLQPGCTGHLLVLASASTCQRLLAPEASLSGLLVEPQSEGFRPRLAPTNRPLDAGTSCSPSAASATRSRSNSRLI